MEWEKMKKRKGKNRKEQEQERKRKRLKQIRLGKEELVKKCKEQEKE